MKHLLIIFCCAASLSAQTFQQYFLDKTLRVDYYHTGTKGTEIFALDKIYDEGIWSGSKTQLVDNLNYGEYMLRVFNVASGIVIYSRGFSTMFNEWHSTDESNAGILKTFHETVRIPFPKATVQLTISRRDKKMIFHELFSTVIDPNDHSVVNIQKRAPQFKSVKLVDNGAPEKKVDLLIIGDGYATADMQKFRDDAKHYSDVLLGTSPFKERKKDFNVWTIEVESKESGIDKPGKNEWKENALGSMYDTFGSARYILTEENRILRDIAGHVPYDAIAILVNDNRYGGGGIYNLYSTCFTQTDYKGMEWQMDYVFVHELGHSFGGLGDEYYTSSVSYTDFYQASVEPWEPNLTAATNKEQLKWKSFVDVSTPIPTPWNKTAYDSLEALRGKLDRLAPDYYSKREPLYQACQSIVKNAEYKGNVGTFEGGGYVSKGIYRPAVDCRMFSLSLVGFDPVCSAAIEKVIDSYVK
ncbi:MAG: M64 family metallopeptidase [Bacteriovoracaceae bacterium]